MPQANAGRQEGRRRIVGQTGRPHECSAQEEARRMGAGRQAAGECRTDRQAAGHAVQAGRPQQNAGRTHGNASTGGLQAKLDSGAKTAAKRLPARAASAAIQTGSGCGIRCKDEDDFEFMDLDDCQDNDDGRTASEKEAVLLLFFRFFLRNVRCKYITY